MKLLILTQKVNKVDPILGFFHRWIEEFAKHYEKVTVICLEEGEHDLPENVKVLSLGKERGNTRWDRICWFYQHIWDERGNYDAVFVHMNQEYILLGGLSWKIFGKRIYLWRNHAEGSILTKLAVRLSNKVFYTSPSSYTAKFPNAVQMPVGIDTGFFKPNSSVKKVPNSVLFLGRIGPVKKVVEFVDKLGDLEREGGPFSATIAGEALEKDKAYEQKVIERVATYDIEDKVKFLGPVSREKALKLYQSHQSYVNMTSMGSFDKTIFEAAACGTNVLVENEDLKKLEGMDERELRSFVIESHSLDKLMGRLIKQING